LQREARKHFAAQTAADNLALMAERAAQRKQQQQEQQLLERQAVTSEVCELCMLYSRDAASCHTCRWRKTVNLASTAAMLCDMLPPKHHVCRCSCVSVLALHIHAPDHNSTEQPAARLKQQNALWDVVLLCRLSIGTLGHPAAGGLPQSTATWHHLAQQCTLQPQRQPQLQKHLQQAVQQPHTWHHRHGQHTALWRQQQRPLVHHQQLRQPLGQCTRVLLLLLRLG
jgi:hypothetical protein